MTRRNKASHAQASLFETFEHRVNAPVDAPVLSTAPGGAQSFEVDADRLAWGRDGKTEGDIHASYSADMIASSSRIRKPFTFMGRDFVAVSFRYGDEEQATAYALLPRRAFNGAATRYADKTARDHGDKARADPQGFYNGMTVRRGKDAYVLCGPPVTFRPRHHEAPTQAGLF